MMTQKLDNLVTAQLRGVNRAGAEYGEVWGEIDKNGKVWDVWKG